MCSLSADSRANRRAGSSKRTMHPHTPCHAPERACGEPNPHHEPQANDGLHCLFHGCWTLQLVGSCGWHLQSFGWSVMGRDADTEALSAPRVTSNQDHYRVRGELNWRPICALQGAICLAFSLRNITVTKTESWSHCLRFNSYSSSTSQLTRTRERLEFGAGLSHISLTFSFLSILLVKVNILITRNIYKLTPTNKPCTHTT
jgi:hypothetical protein